MACDRRIGFERKPKLAQPGTTIAAAAISPPAVIGGIVERPLHVVARRSTVIAVADHRRPAPSTVIVTRSAGASPSMPFLRRAAQRRSADRCVIASLMPGAIRRSCARRASPAPDRRCRRRAAGDRRSRSARTTARRPRLRTRIRLKSVVPPPTSQTSAICTVVRARSARPAVRPSTRRTRRSVPRSVSGRRTAPPARLRRSARAPPRRTMPAR